MSIIPTTRVGVSGRLFASIRLLTMLLASPTMPMSMTGLRAFRIACACIIGDIIPSDIRRSIFFFLKSPKHLSFPSFRDRSTTRHVHISRIDVNICHLSASSGLNKDVNEKTAEASSVHKMIRSKTRRDSGDRRRERRAKKIQAFETRSLRSNEPVRTIPRVVSLIILTIAFCGNDSRRNILQKTSRDEHFIHDDPRLSH